MKYTSCADQRPPARGLGLSVRDLMSTDVVSVAPDLSLRSLAELFAARHLGGAPVMAGSRVVGVISTSDILAFEASTPDAAAAMRERAEREPEPSEEWREGDDPPAAFFTESWMGRRCRRPAVRRGDRNPDGDRLCGVLSTLDLVRAVGQGRV